MKKCLHVNKEVTLNLVRSKTVNIELKLKIYKRYYRSSCALRIWNFDHDEYRWNDVRYFLIYNFKKKIEGK